MSSTKFMYRSSFWNATTQLRPSTFDVEITSTGSVDYSVEASIVIRYLVSRLVIFLISKYDMERVTIIRNSARSNP
jgi:hypothetical protein